MNVSMDGSGNVTTDTTYSTTGINTIKSQMVTISNELKTFDNSQIIALRNELNNQYVTLISFTKFLEEWIKILQEVEL